MNRSILLAIFAASLLGACTDDATTPSASAKTEKLPSDDVIYGLHQVMTKDGVRTGVLDSDTAFMRESHETADLRQVHITFYSDLGAESGVLTSDTGEYSVATGSFIARGNALPALEPRSSIICEGFWASMESSYPKAHGDF